VAQAYHQLASQHCQLLAWMEISREGCKPFVVNAAP
jgi:hypothetical protein